MADSKVINLTATTAPLTTDLLYGVIDPAGTPLDRKLAIIDLLHTLIGPQPPCARLTTESGVPVSTSDRTAQGTIYWTPYNSSRVWLYTGSKWTPYVLTEISLALTVTSGKNYDVFVYDNSGTLTLELSAAWTNDTTRADALALQNGMYVKSGATTRLHIGTIRASGANVIADSKANRYLWNRFNKVTRALVRIQATNHTYTVATYRYWNNDTANKFEFVIGEIGESISVSSQENSYTSAAGTTAALHGAELNWTSGSPTLAQTIAQTNSIDYVIHSITNVFIPTLGYNYVSILEYQAAGGTGTHDTMSAVGTILN